MTTGKIGKEGQAVSLEEARQALGVSRSMIYRLADDGRLRTVRFGRRRLVPLTELERVLAEGIEESPGGAEQE